MNIILIGYRGSGKSAVGNRLAARLKMTFVDIDNLIEDRQGVPITDIVKSHGWDRFRMLEKRIIEEISIGNDLVIAPGGGAVLDAGNVIALRRNGFIIWLKADQDTLLKRMNQDPGTITRRPALTGEGTFEEVEKTVLAREPFYERASEIQIDTSMLAVDAVVERILAIINDKVRIG